MPTTRTTDKHLHNNNGAIMQRVLVIVSLFAALISLAFASMASADNKQAPDKLISDTTNNMLVALKQDREIIAQQPGHVQALANEIIMPHVDFKRMSSWVLGKHWRRATAEQKKAFPEQFRALILRTYATALSEYTDETIRYLPLRSEDGASDVTVRTVIERNAGPGIPVAYRLHQTDNGWKVYDINIDGISLVNNYRRSFSSEIRRNGLDSLINKLAGKNKPLPAKQSQLASSL